MVRRLIIALGLILVLSGSSFAQTRIRQWTYPGNIQYHLQRDHGINTAGMSFPQMVDLHNRIHEAEVRGSVTSRQTYRPTTRFFRWRR